MLGDKTDNSISDGDGNAQVGHNSGTVNVGISFEQHQAALEKALTSKAADMERAHGAERELLQKEVDDLRRELADPSASLKIAQKRIADLEALLDRESNEFGSERIIEAKAALERCDYSIADAIFAEIEAKEELAVQRLARASFGRGEVAEAEIRWRDAAKYYARASQLDPSYDHLMKAREFAWRAGDYLAALRHGEDLMVLAKDGALTELQKASALNEHALTLEAQGQYAEAEALYRKALAIDAKTIGVEHPRYASRLNNLAGALVAQGQYAEAEAMYREALAIDVKTIGVEPASYAIRLNNLFECRGRMSRRRRCSARRLRLMRRRSKGMVTWSIQTMPSA